MRKIILPAFLILLMLFAFTACDDDDSGGSSSSGTSVDPSEAHYMNMSEMATIISILRLDDDVWDFNGDWYYVYDDDDDELIYEYAFVDYDGDAEYDEGEQYIVYFEVTNPLNDDDDIYAYYYIYDYSDDDSGDSLYGTLVSNAILDGYSEYSAGESDSYKRYNTVEYDYTATIGGEEHTLVMTVEYTRTQTKNSSWEWEYDYNYTGSDVVLDGVTLYGYEDYMNVLRYYS